MTTPLEKVHSKIRDFKKRNLRPLVVFDIDDTLIDCRFRKMYILKEFSSQAANSDRWPAECQKVLDSKLSDYEYRVSDCLSNLEIKDQEFASSIRKYWFSKYFDNDYLSTDEFFPNAIDCIKTIRSLGAEVCYFTGRDEPGMGAGTSKKLLEHGLNDKLMMKPSVEMSDVSYKVEYLEKVTDGYDLVCFFENEIKNLNPFVDNYPDALFVWLDTLCSPNQPVKHPKILTMTNWHIQTKLQ